MIIRHFTKELSKNKIVIIIFNGENIYSKKVFKNTDKLGIRSYIEHSIKYDLHLSDCKVHNEPYAIKDKCDCRCDYLKSIYCFL